MGLKNAYSMLKKAAWDFGGDDAMTLAAALAFYAALSLAPLLLILVAVTSLIGPEMQKQVIQQIEKMVGSQTGNVVEQIVERAGQQRFAGWLSAAVGFAVLLFSATGAFGQMQHSLNRIWEVRPKSTTVWLWLRKRGLSLLLILGIGLILLVSLGLSAAINLIFAGTHGSFWEAANGVGMFLIYILLFALIYKILPDVQIHWKDVWMGAIITALLFEIGRFLIGWYLGRSSVGSPYGAAGSLIVVLLWIYYASLIFFFGAELTQAYAHSRGRRMQPQEYAEKTPDAERDEQQKT